MWKIAAQYYIKYKQLKDFNLLTWTLCYNFFHLNFFFSHLSLLINIQQNLVSWTPSKFSIELGYIWY